MKDKYIDEERDDCILPAAEDQELMSVREKKDFNHSFRIR